VAVKLKDLLKELTSWLLIKKVNMENVYNFYFLTKMRKILLVLHKI